MFFTLDGGSALMVANRLMLMFRSSQSCKIRLLTAVAVFIAPSQIFFLEYLKRGLQKQAMHRRLGTYSVADYRKMYTVLCCAVDGVIGPLERIPPALPYARLPQTALQQAEDICIDTTAYVEPVRQRMDHCAKIDRPRKNSSRPSQTGRSWLNLSEKSHRVQAHTPRTL